MNLFVVPASRKNKRYECAWLAGSVLGLTIIFFNTEIDRFFRARGIFSSVFYLGIIYAWMGAINGGIVYPFNLTGRLNRNKANVDERNLRNSFYSGILVTASSIFTVSKITFTSLVLIIIILISCFMVDYDLSIECLCTIKGLLLGTSFAVLSEVVYLQSNSEVAIIFSIIPMAIWTIITLVDPS